METKNRIQDLPVDTRPYERCIANGPKALSDAELLASVIRSGSKGMGVIALAEEIIAKTETKNIAGLCKLSVKDLQSITGIGKVKAVQIVCIAELCRRISMTGKGEQIIFHSPKVIADHYMEEMRHKEQEEFRILLLDAKSALISDPIISIGTVNSTVASPREIFIYALKEKAVGMILMHNHPSGDPTPSRNDIVCTGRIREAGELIGISVIDHIIIGDNKYISFVEKQLWH